MARFLPSLQRGTSGSPRVTAGHRGQATPQTSHALSSSAVPSLGRRGVRPPFLDVAAVLMDADRRGVDHLQVTVICLRYRLGDTTPHADLGPAPKLVGTGRRQSVALRDIPHGERSAGASRCRSGPWVIELPEDAVTRASGGDPRYGRAPASEQVWADRQARRAPPTRDRAQRRRRRATVSS
jgi:hypothetical protein